MDRIFAEIREGSGGREYIHEETLAQDARRRLVVEVIMVDMLGAIEEEIADEIFFQEHGYHQEADDVDEDEIEDEDKDDNGSGYWNGTASNQTETSDMSSNTFSNSNSTFTSSYTQPSSSAAPDHVSSSGPSHVPFATRSPSDAGTAQNKPTNRTLSLSGEADVLSPVQAKLAVARKNVMRRLTVGAQSSPLSPKDGSGGNGTKTSPQRTPSKTIFQRLSVYAHAVHTPAASAAPAVVSEPVTALSAASSPLSSSPNISPKLKTKSTTVREPELDSLDTGRKKGGVSLVMGLGGKRSSFVVVPPKPKADQARRFSVVSSDYLSSMVKTNKKKNNAVIERYIKTEIFDLVLSKIDFSVYDKMYDKRRFSVKSSHYIQSNVHARRRQTKFYVDKGIVDPSDLRMGRIGNPYDRSKYAAEQVALPVFEEGSENDANSISSAREETGRRKSSAPITPSLRTRLKEMKEKQASDTAAAAIAAAAAVTTAAAQTNTPENSCRNPEDVWDESYLYNSKNKNKNKSPGMSSVQDAGKGHGKETRVDQYAHVGPRYMTKTSANKSKRMSFYQGAENWTDVETHLAEVTPHTLVPDSSGDPSNPTKATFAKTVGASKDKNQDEDKPVINARRPSVLLAVMNDDASRLKAMPTKDLISANHALELRIARMAQGLIERGDTAELHYVNPNPSVDPKLDAPAQPLIKTVDLSVLAMQSDRAMAALVSAGDDGAPIDDNKGSASAGNDVLDRLYSSKTDSQRRKRQSFFQLVNDLDTSIKGKSADETADESIAIGGGAARTENSPSRRRNKSPEKKFPLENYLSSPKPKPVPRPGFGESVPTSRDPTGKPTPSRIPKRTPRPASTTPAVGSSAQTKRLFRPTVAARYKRMSFYSGGTDLNALMETTETDGVAGDVPATPTTDAASTTASAPPSTAAARVPTGNSGEGREGEDRVAPMVAFEAKKVVVPARRASSVNVKGKAYINAMLEKGKCLAEARTNKPYAHKGSRAEDLARVNDDDKFFDRKARRKSMLK